MGRGDLSTDALTGVHILLVDDDADSLEIYGASLRYLGALVTIAKSAAAALAVLHRVVPDVIVSDLAMRGGDGLSFIRRARALPAARSVPAIALTAYEELFPWTEVGDAGFQAQLRKPAAPAALCRTIMRVLERT